MLSPSRSRHRAQTIAVLAVFWASALGLPARAARTDPSMAALGPVAARHGGWLVVAPHPDDEALIAGGVIRGAVERGEPVDVVFLTNGDFDCANDGITRDREALRGLGLLGVGADHVHFLGYPDGFLAQLGTTPLPAVRRRAGGPCKPGNTTYGLPEAGRQTGRDTGGDGARPAGRSFATRGRPYTAAALVEDLRGVLLRVAPATVIVTHPQDIHPDHAQAYAFVRQALATSELAVAPRLWRALVHNGDCWPTGTEPGPDCPPGRVSPEEPTPALSGRLVGYVGELRLPVPESCLGSSREQNLKLAAIFAHRTQVHDDPRSYLVSFARRDEVFFPEELLRDLPPGLPGGLSGGAAAHELTSSEAAAEEALHLEAGKPLTHPLTAAQPVAFSVTLGELTGSAEETQAILLSAKAPERARYELVLEREVPRQEKHLRLRKMAAGRSVVLLQDWVLPHDAGHDRPLALRLMLSMTSGVESVSSAGPQSGGSHGPLAHAPLTFTFFAGDVLRGQAVDPQADWSLETGAIAVTAVLAPKARLTALGREAPAAKRP